MSNSIALQSENAFRSIYDEVKRCGKLVSPRGLEVLEIENFSFSLPPRVRFASFADRKLSLNYIKDEFLWYLKGDRFDLSICEKAKIWKDIVNPDLSLNSNYGQYIFGLPGNQFDRVVEILRDDKDSRRAAMTILSRDHVLSDTDDLPCTYALGFRIRGDKLNMSVHMRSQDAIFGLGNDIPTFSFIHEMVWANLSYFYDGLEMGTYHHIADSFHVYQRHFEMLDKIVNGKSAYVPVDCPAISGLSEVYSIMNLPYREGMRVETATYDPEYKFVRWLMERN